jgi:hypothetical protein
MTKEPEPVGLALVWLWITLPMWVLGFATPGFIPGFIGGMIFVPVWALASCVVASLFDEKKRK